MRFLVTAGGTSEKIDSVRRITNSATGRLGCRLACCLAEDSRTERIFYICGEQAARPDASKTEIIPVADAAELEAAVRHVLAENTINAIVHSMAVSDYRVKTITTPRLLAQALASSTPGRDISAESLAAALEPEKGLERSAKLPSGENLILALEPTLKIISLFHELAPDALLVGFKLLDGVPLDTLIDTAYELLKKNHCAYVLANDAKDITDTAHTGYLVDQNKNVEKYLDKNAIARGIARRLLPAGKGDSAA